MIKFITQCATTFGQTLVLVFGDQYVEMTYVTNYIWSCSVKDHASEIEYSYQIINPDEGIIKEVGPKRHLSFVYGPANLIVEDSFRWPGVEEVFKTVPFVEALFKHSYVSPDKKQINEVVAFNVEAFGINPNEALGVLGNVDVLGDWAPYAYVPMIPVCDSTWTVHIPLQVKNKAIEYKFVVFDKDTRQIVRWEEGDNRVILHNPPVVINAQFRTSYKWRGAGVAIPVFSLRSECDFGVGEFEDLKMMVDWAVLTGQKLIQILPINDTTNTHTNLDSYPYSSNSVYALHPIYLRVEKVGVILDKSIRDKFETERKQFNTASYLMYQDVMQAKHEVLHLLYLQDRQILFDTMEFKRFMKESAQWLVPYAVFSVLREQNSTANFRKWPIEQSSYSKEFIAQFVQQNEVAVGYYYFLQFHLDKQLREVRAYAHERGVVLKGDLPIGISPNSVDAWQYPHLFHLDKQAGAPPDDFSITGQNWSFPTYNWEVMSLDGFAWWKSRFKNMSRYFDAYRIDHILGFFRIWEIPMHAKWGLLGCFNPALPLTEQEIRDWGVAFDADIMVKACFSEQLIDDYFGKQSNWVKNTFLEYYKSDLYVFKTDFDTQVKLIENASDLAGKWLNDLLMLHAEVLFIEDNERPKHYHPRITVYLSKRFKHLNLDQQQALMSLYDDFYFKRHDEFWKESALKKLPILIKATNMLVCGEDLGMVPHSVPEVMRELNIASLEIQRMPKDITTPFVIPANTPYLSVCSTGTHDTSTLRQWWKEQKETTANYFHRVLNRVGNAPVECTPQIAAEIVTQHLAANAMWVILPWQDYMAMSDCLRNPEQDKERINEPSNPQHFWCYRMHIKLEDLLKASTFNDQLRLLVKTYR